MNINLFMLFVLVSRIACAPKDYSKTVGRASRRSIK